MSTIHEADGTLVLHDRVVLPDVLDILIVGGGPAGTAAAFRAKELGMQALVIDFDDILKRIRDYPKDKLILPSFGGGDKMSFPAAGQCIESLYFEDVDKDDICASWKKLYHSLSIPAKIGVELIGLEKLDGGLWTAKVWNHRTQQPQTYVARHVVLALGRGVPRRFDIPGNTEGVAYRLDDPSSYIEGPVCVVGGGTSAAEAVISISGAKVAAGDDSPVYWSYRGSKMPRVSKALAEVFFEAYVGNGNVRYYPLSEPVAVVVGPDREEYVSVRIDRKSPPGRPQETSHLEFLKTRCIACIGDDIPETFLGSLGIEMLPKATGDEKKMMVVTPLLETRQPNVYLIGDLLSQSYLESDGFPTDAGDCRQVKHRGNIKASLRDGVFIAEVIRQRLDGQSQIDVVIRDASTPPAERQTGLVSVLASGSERAEDGPVASEPSPVEEAESGRLVRVTAAGIDEDEFELNAHGITTVGRTDCDLSFPEDTALADNHASITHRTDGYYLRDDGSRSGTFLKIRPGKSHRLPKNGLLRVGRQVLVLGTGASSAHVEHFDARGKFRHRHPLTRATTVFGRSGGKSNPDVVLDDQDHTLSRFHFSITLQGGEASVRDFNSRNGTYVRVVEGEKLENGDYFRVGSQLFRIEVGAELPTKISSMPTMVFRGPQPPLPDASPSKVADTSIVPAASAPAGAPSSPEAGVAATVTFLGQDVSVPIDPSDSLLTAADENDVAIDCECWMGMCGLDVVRVVDGSAHLDAPSEREVETLQRKGLEPGPYRLACVTHATGPVVVEVVD